jgi:hypothetical protein
VLEALHGLVSPVRAISLLPGSTLIAQYLRRALTAGDPAHAARALAYEAAWRSVDAPGDSQERGFGRSRELARALGEPTLIAEVELMQGAAFLAQHQMGAAESHLWRAHEILRSECPGQPWLLTSSRMYLGQAWLGSAKFPEIRCHMVGWLEEAKARDDRYAVAALTGAGGASLRHALDDAPDTGLAELDAAMAPWPSEPFGWSHFGAFFATSLILASSADGPRFCAFLDRDRARFERAFLLRAPTPRLALLMARSQALLQSIDSPQSGAGPQLAERARAEQRMLSRLPGPGAEALTQYVEGWFHLLAGNRDAAHRCIAHTCEVARQTGVYFESGARYILGMLESGETGRQQCEEVRQQIVAEGWRDWRRGLAMRIPGNLQLLDVLR